MKKSLKTILPDRICLAFSFAIAVFLQFDSLSNEIMSPRLWL
jgi:hypothetical protein